MLFAFFSPAVAEKCYGISLLFVIHFLFGILCLLLGLFAVLYKWCSLKMANRSKKYCSNRRVLVFLSHISRRFTRWLCICGLTEIVHYIIDGLFLSFSHRNLLPAVLCLIVVVVMCRSGKHSFFFVCCSLSFRSNRDRQFTSCQHNNQIPSLINNRCVHHFISHQITMNEINQAIEMASTNMYVPCEVHTEHTNKQQQKIV